jgi:hypothetical protein
VLGDLREDVRNPSRGRSTPLSLNLSMRGA